MEFGNAVLTDLKLQDFGLEADTADLGDPLELRDTYHLMGGCTMGNDSADSVVDRFGQVHGVRNLFVCGAGVFPAGGYCNPTLTAIALALRAVDSLTGGTPT